MGRGAEVWCVIERGAFFLVPVLFGEGKKS